MRRHGAAAAVAAAGCALLLVRGAHAFVRDGDDAASTAVTQRRHASLARAPRRLFADGDDAREVAVIVRWRGAPPTYGGADADVHADSTVDVDAAASPGGLTVTFEVVNVSTLKAWRAAGAVESIEPDAIVRAAQQQAPAATVVPAALAPDGGSADPPPVLAQVDPPNYGLDRLDQRFLPLDGRYHFRLDGSTGVAVYVVDSGLRATHTQIVGRSLPGRNFNTADQATSNTGDCGNGHGSHLAGIVAGNTVGVAKGTFVVPVRVYGCAMEGPLSQVLAGLNWVLQDARAAAAATGRRSVVNLSFGTDRSPSMDDVVRRMVDAGIVVVAAAGNEGRSACEVSPAGEPAALTVGSTDEDDGFSSYSNKGACVDVSAPGRAIVSIGIASDTAGAVMSGTSMAAPAVAGAAALYLQAYPAASPADVMAWVTCAATTNVISGDLGGAPNRLLFVDAAPAAFPPPGTPCGAMASPSPGANGGGGGGAGGTPPPTCPRACSGAGACSAAGKCACTCHAVGTDCGTRLAVTELPGLAGVVNGSTLAAASHFGDPSPDAYFAVTVPPDATALSLTTCNPGTDFDTTLFLLRRCFTGTDLASLGIAAEADDDPRYPDRKCSTIRLQAPPPGRYYVLLEGFVDTRGAYELSYFVESRSGVPATPTPSPGHLTAAGGATGGASALSPLAALEGVGVAFAVAVLLHVWGPGLFW